MKNPMHKLRRFFVRSRTFNASAARTATQSPADDDSDSTRLSGAFIVVLALHIIAVVGVFAFARIKENRKANAPQTTSTQKTALQKTAPVKPVTVAPKPVAPAAAASLTPANPALTTQTTPKPASSTVAQTETKSAQTAAQKATPSTANQRTFKNYVVRKNENPAKIARENGCTYEELLKLNNIKDPKKIQVGQVLKVPVKNG